MIHRLLIALFLWCFSLQLSYSQGIRGQITNELGEGIPFANIYVSQLSTGIISNIEGKYELKQPPGYWDILFQYIGYQSQTKLIAIDQGFQEINIQLQKQLYSIADNDSIKKARRHFKLKHLIFGKTYNYSVDSIQHYKYFTIPKLTDPSWKSFNSVDGLRIELPFNYTMSDSSGHLLVVEPVLAYAFGRQKVDAWLNYNQRLGGLANTSLSAGVGTTTKDFNSESGLMRLTNDVYTLWREENFKRFYRRDFVQFGAGTDIANGLNFKATLEYSENIQLQNNSTYSFVNRKEKQIQPNIPVNNSLAPWQLENHQSLISRMTIEFTPRQRYRVKNHTKIYTDSKFPTFTIGYNRAYSEIIGSDSRFSLIQVGIRQNINFGFSDYISYQVNAGKYLNNQRLYFEDFRHFNTQITNFSFAGYDNSFRLLPFYQYSTDKQFVEMHSEIHLHRFILKQLPLIKNSSITEKLFINYLGTPQINNYAEAGYGIENVLLLLNIETVAGFKNGKFISSAIKVSLNLNRLENKE